MIAKFFLRCLRRELGFFVKETRGMCVRESSMLKQRGWLDCGVSQVRYYQCSSLELYEACCSSRWNNNDDGLTDVWIGLEKKGKDVFCCRRLGEDTGLLTVLIVSFKGDLYGVRCTLMSRLDYFTVQSYTVYYLFLSDDDVSSTLFALCERYTRYKFCLQSLRMTQKDRERIY